MAKKLQNRYCLRNLTTLRTKITEISQADVPRNNAGKKTECFKYD